MLCAMTTMKVQASCSQQSSSTNRCRTICLGSFRLRVVISWTRNNVYSAPFGNIPAGFGFVDRSAGVLDPLGLPFHLPATLHAR